MKDIQRYASVWLKLTINSFSAGLSSRLSATLFLLGKVLRFLFFAIFLIVLLTQTKSIEHYTLNQARFFFLTFNLIDTTAQLFFREVYRFRHMVVTGDFDLVLTKPMNPLFRALAGGADPLDLVMLIPYVAALFYVARLIGPVTFVNVLYYLILLINAFLIATSFHILVLAIAIVTTEIDHAIMIYRDITNMARVPVDIYREPIRSIITFVIPIGVMMTFPAKAFLGLLSPLILVISIGIGYVFFALCLRIWRFALTQYSSASS